MVFPSISITGGPSTLKVNRTLDREKLLRWLPGPFDDDVDVQITTNQSKKRRVPYDPIAEMRERSRETFLAYFNAGSGKKV
jgi:hypothetical protein